MGLLDGKKAAIRCRQRSEHRLGDLEASTTKARNWRLHRGGNFGKRVRPLAEGIRLENILPCDVTKDEEIEKFSRRSTRDGRTRYFGHAIAFAHKEDLSNPLCANQSRGLPPRDGRERVIPSGTRTTSGAADEGRNGSIVTLTYMGSEKVIPNYNVMV